MARKRRQSELPDAAELYDRLLAEQDGHCALCEATPKKRKLHLDHDHGTGRVRGLLCYRCNRGLPAYLDERWHYKAANYIARGRHAEFGKAAP